VDVAARLGHPDAVNVPAASRGRGRAEPAGGRITAATADERGRDEFANHCASCHQTDGSGLARLGAPLRNSTWVLGREDALTRIVLNGLQGDLVMPPMGTLDDHQIADVLTYIRRAWGHAAGAVSVDAVARARAASAGRATPWTRRELSALTPAN
jgi:mono/diheme cytochrome c family protein